MVTNLTAKVETLTKKTEALDISMKGREEKSEKLEKKTKNGNQNRRRLGLMWTVWVEDKRQLRALWRFLR